MLVVEDVLAAAVEGVLLAAEIEGVLDAEALSEVGRGGKGRAALAGETVGGGAGAAVGASGGGAPSLLGAMAGVEVEAAASEAVEDDDCEEVATEGDTVDVSIASVEDDGDEVVVLIEEGVGAAEEDEVTAGFFRSCWRRGPESRGSVNWVVLLWWSTK